MRLLFALAALFALLCIVNAVKVDVSVDVAPAHHHRVHPHHENTAETPVATANEAEAEVDAARAPASSSSSSRQASANLDVDDEGRDDGTAHMRKPARKFDPNSELPIVGAVNEPVSGAAALINLANRGTVAELKKGAAGRGISSSKFDLHLMRIVNQFNVVNSRLNLPRALEVLAYVLATAEHETARYIYMAEIGGSRKRYAPYYGRGYVQLTWKQNYARYNSKLKAVGLLRANEDIVKNPSFLSGDNERARDCMAFVIIDGMISGAFGRRVIDYINASKLDYVNARRSVNILDKASMIAGYARAWATILKKAKAVPNASEAEVDEAEFEEEY